jgi:hypothetical protein
MAAGDTLTREQFDSWVAPPYALAKLNGVADLRVLISDIAKHLEDGLLKSAAETMKVTGSDHSWERVEIDPRFWIGWACLADDAFWQIGNREVFSDSVACRKFGLAPLRLYRVRFEPEGLERLRPSPPIGQLSPAILAEAVRATGVTAKPISKAETRVDDAGWLLAREAVKLLAPLYEHLSLAKEALIDLAAAGRVTTWCATYILPDRDEDPTLRTDENHHLPIKFWHHFDRPYLRDTEDWALGNFCIQLRDEFDSFDNFVVKALGVRFNEDDLRALPELRAAFAPPRLADPVRPRSPNAPLAQKVDRKELREWVRDFMARNPGSPFHSILQNARSAFPQLRVTERPVKAAIAELGLTLSPGNPRTLQK